MFLKLTSLGEANVQVPIKELGVFGELDVVWHYWSVKFKVER